MAEPLSHSHFQMTPQLHMNRNPVPRDQHASEIPQSPWAKGKSMSSSYYRTKTNQSSLKGGKAEVGGDATEL